MAQPNFKKAAEVAKRARQTLGAVPPFDPETVAERDGIQVVYATFEPPHNDSISGFYRKSDNKIVINNDISSARKVFTIAHELGHAKLHQEYIKSKNYQPVFRTNVHEGDKPIEEVEADQFAANFLVPLELLKKYRDIATVEELAKIFAVSEDVIFNRLGLLSRYPSLANG